MNIYYAKDRVDIASTSNAAYTLKKTLEAYLKRQERNTNKKLKFC
jgi:hypothetical protein